MPNKDVKVVVSKQRRPYQNKKGKWKRGKQETRVTKTIMKHGGKSTELERVLKNTPEKERSNVIKEWRKQDTKRILGSGAESTAFGASAILTNKSNEAMNNKTNQSSNITQNINGGITNTKNVRDDDEGYDYPGFN